MKKDDNDDNDSGSGPEWGVDRGRERCRMSVPRDTAVICLICGQTNIILEVVMMLMTMMKFKSIIKTIFTKAQASSTTTIMISLIISAGVRFPDALPINGPLRNDAAQGLGISEISSMKIPHFCAQSETVVDEDSSSFFSI